MHRFLTFLAELYGWIRIMISPLFIGSIIGLIIYVYYPNSLTLVAAILFSIMGLILGIRWATKEWKKRGTIQFLARISAVPELDNLSENEKEKTKEE